MSYDLRTRTIHGQSANLSDLLGLQVIEKYGAPGEIRTPDPLLRRQMLYPAELRARRLDLTQLAAVEQCCWVQRWVQLQPQYSGSFATPERRVRAQDANTAA